MRKLFIYVYVYLFFLKKGHMIAKVFILIFISTGEMIRFDEYFSNVETNHHV